MLRRKSICVLLVLVMAAGLSPLAAAQDYTDGRAAGVQDGSTHPTGAFGWSLAWGFGFGIIGGLGSLAYYASVSPEPDTITVLDLREMPSEYRLGYLEGYKETAKRRVVTQSATGAGLGVLAAVIFVGSLLQ